MSDLSSKRNYGIDLLRLFSMFMVVGLHVLGKGGILSSVETMTLKGETVWFFEISMFCAVNCFAIISGYLGYRSRHRSSNLVNICFAALFYCFAFSVGYVLYTQVCSVDLSFKFLVKCLVPTLFGTYWYISGYFCLFFFMPILNKVVEAPRVMLKKLSIIIIPLGMVVVSGHEVSGLANGYSFLWLAVLYVFGAYIAKYSPFEKWSFKVNLIGFISCTVLTLFSRIVIEIITVALIDRPYMTDFFISYTSPFIIMNSIFLFNIFVKLNPKDCVKKAACFLSPFALGVYLIHCHPFVFDILLGGRFIEWASKPVYILIPLAFAATLAIFFACLFIEMLRMKLFKVLRINLLAEKTASMVDSTVNKIIKSESHIES